MRWRAPKGGLRRPCSLVLRRGTRLWRSCLWTAFAEYTGYVHRLVPPARTSETLAKLGDVDGMVTAKRLFVVVIVVGFESFVAVEVTHAVAVW